VRRVEDLVIDHHPEQFTYKSHIKDIRPKLRRDLDHPARVPALYQQHHCTRLATAMLYGIKSDTSRFRAK